MSDCAFIDDGFSGAGYIRGVRGLFPDVRFTFREMAPADRINYFRSLENLDGAGRVAVDAKLLETRLNNWDLKFRSGQIAPITLATVQKLKGGLLARLVNQITGLEGPDEDPRATAEQAATDAADKAEAARTGVPFRPGEGPTQGG